MSDALHPSLHEIAALLEHERRHLLSVWASIPPADRERRPSPDAWTPAEVMDHLRLVEGGSGRLLAHRLVRAREAGLGAEPDPRPRSGSLAEYDVAGGSRRLDAPEGVRPAPDASAATAETGLEEVRATLRTLLADASGSALGEVRARHPLLGELDMYQWLELIALHERRHARQLERVRDALAGHTTGGAAARA